MGMEPPSPAGPGVVAVHVGSAGSASVRSTPASRYGIPLDHAGPWFHVGGSVPARAVAPRMWHGGSVPGVSAGPASLSPTPARSGAGSTIAILAQPVLPASPAQKPDCLSITTSVYW